jgi:hypothetical protein
MDRGIRNGLGANSREFQPLQSFCPAGQQLIGSQFQSDIPDYSNDIASAWQIVELLRLKPECQWQINNGQGEWVVKYRQNEREELEVRAHTVMLGICYVALQSVMCD